MAKKRGKKVSRRRSRVRHRAGAQKQVVASRVRSTRANIRIVLNNLIVFFILFLISLILYSVIQSEVLSNLFFIFMLGFGFISVAFLLTLVVFLFLKLLQRK